MKNIVIINGHPNKGSFNNGLFEAYKKGALTAGASIKEIIITTLDQPSWYYWFAFGRPSMNQLKKSVLEFCGVKPVKVTYVGPIKNTEPGLRKKWLDKIEKSGENLK
jgi:putative NADPH-quinone reductase